MECFVILLSFASLSFCYSDHVSEDDVLEGSPVLPVDSNAGGESSISWIHQDTICGPVCATYFSCRQSCVTDGVFTFSQLCADCFSPPECAAICDQYVFEGMWSIDWRELAKTL